VLSGGRRLRGEGDHGGPGRRGSRAQADPRLLLKGLRALVVDDDPIMRLIVRKALGRFGCEVETVMNGEDALEALRSSLFSVVVLDLDLPGIDGFAVAEKIRDRTSSVLHHDVAIVALTSRTSAEDRRRCHEAGMDSFLAKPVRVRELVRRIAEVSGRGGKGG
jgi:CheY-like chemotaxis protein